MRCNYLFIPYIQVTTSGTYRVCTRYFQNGVLEQYGMHWNMIFENIVTFFYHCWRYSFFTNQICVKNADFCANSLRPSDAYTCQHTRLSSSQCCKIWIFSFKKMHNLKMSSEKWRPFCLVLNVLMRTLCTYKSSPHLTTLGCSKFSSCLSMAISRMVLMGMPSSVLVWMRIFLMATNWPSFLRSRACSQENEEMINPNQKWLMTMAGLP